MFHFDDAAFVIVQVVAYLTCASSLYLAARHYGSDVVTLLFGAGLYSYGFEALAVKLGAYWYDCRFAPMLPGHVPLWIPIGWGTIVFAATLTSNRLGMRWWARPFAAALLALLLDIALDPLAVGLRYWTWRTPGTFYAVTWSNFTGWLLIVGSYSFVIEWIYEKRKSEKRLKRGEAGFWKKEVLQPFLAIPVAFLLCVLLHLVFQIGPEYLSGGSTTVSGAFFLALLVLCVGVCAYSLPRYSRHARPQLALLVVPAAYFVLFITFAFATSLHHTAPELRVWFPFVACVVMLGYLWPSIDVLPHAFMKREVREAAEERLRRHARERRESDVPLFPILARLLPDPEQVEAVPSLERRHRD